MSIEYKFKKLRNKDSYMSAFLERRKKAADFASMDKNKMYYKYEMPFYILKNEEEIMELKRKNKNQMNSVRNKTEFYKTYKTLKKSITNKRSNNSSISNKVNIEKENNKYYLSQGLLEEKRNKKFFDENLDILDNNNNHNKINKNNKYNNIKNHTIDVTSKNKKEKFIDNKSKRNFSWKNLQIQKTSSLNNYEITDSNKNKKENEIEIMDQPALVESNEYEYYINNNQNNKFVNPTTRENDINKIIEKYKNSNIYNDEININKYNDSPLNHNELEQNYQYNKRKPKNFSEPQDIFEKTKKIYSLKDTKSNGNFRNSCNNFNCNYISKTKDISPIKTHYKYETKELNGNKNLENIINSQTWSINGNNSRSDTNIKLKNNLKQVKNNQKQNENQDLNLGYKNDKDLDSYNRDKLKDVGILYKNKKYYIENDINNLEIPLLVEDNPKKKEINNLENNNKENIKRAKEDNRYQEQNSEENDIEKSSNSFKISKGKEMNIQSEKYINSLENKTQLMINTNNNNFNLSKPKENNNKIKNIKAQSYKKLSEGRIYESLKEKFESFLKPKEEKEPNIQSKVFNSLLSSKEELNNNNKIKGNHNKSLIRNIQDKIKILKSNKTESNTKEYNNYLNEIDKLFAKIKLKEEKDNQTLKKYYEELIQKENNEIDNEENNKMKRKKEKEKENIKPKENKKNIIQKSNRLENIIRNSLNNKKYNYYDYHYLSNKINKSKDKENIDINQMYCFRNSAPDINLIVDNSNDNNIKIIDEKEFLKLKKKNLKSARIYNNKLSKKETNTSYRRNSDTLSNYDRYVSPRLIIKDITHKIMPPNNLN